MFEHIALKAFWLNGSVSSLFKFTLLIKEFDARIGMCNDDE